jgi:hypothetical protein
VLHWHILLNHVWSWIHDAINRQEMIVMIIAIIMQIFVIIILPMLATLDEQLLWLREHILYQASHFALGVHICQISLSLPSKRQ